jgi:hypothetical protein
MVLEAVRSQDRSGVRYLYSDDAKLTAKL